MKKQIQDYHRFSFKLAMTTGCTIVLTQSLGQLIQTLLIPAVAQYAPGWALILIEAVGASIGLYWINRKG